MPELPEVETIRLGLEKYLVGVKPRGGHATLRGHKIENIEIRLLKIFSGDPKAIIGARFTAVRRAGKGLIMDLDNGYSIAVHIKLTGQLLYQGPNTPKGIKISEKVGATLPNKWTHVIFHLDKDATFYYNDLRQFGWIRIVESSKLKDESFFGNLGPEPFKNLTLALFQKIVASSGRPIKVLLMDQAKIAGIGNIYANDGLNLAKISPQRKASSLSKNEMTTLFHAIEKVLKKGIESGGASELSYVNALGQEGSYQKHFLTYGREGEKCFNCGSTIKKIKLGGRGTYFCEKCQK